MTRRQLSIPLYCCLILGCAGAFADPARAGVPAFGRDVLLPDPPIPSAAPWGRIDVAAIAQDTGGFIARELLRLESARKKFFSEKERKESRVALALGAAALGIAGLVGALASVFFSHERKRKQRREWRKAKDQGFVLDFRDGAADRAAPSTIAKLGVVLGVPGTERLKS